MTVKTSKHNLELFDEVHNGDSLQWLRGLPSESVDCCVTDPPYCSGGYQEAAKRTTAFQGVRSESSMRERLGWFANDTMGTGALVWMLRIVAIELFRVLKPGGSFLCFTDWRMVTELSAPLESAGMKKHSLIVWDKGVPGLGVGFRCQHEMVLHYTKGRGLFYSKRSGDVLKAARIPGKERVHPTQKPVDLIQQLLRVVCPRGGVVLDPFCGAGSVPVAAALHGASTLSCEWNAVFAEHTRERLAATRARVAAGRHFNDAEAATREGPGQPSLFAAMPLDEPPSEPVEMDPPDEDEAMGDDFEGAPGCGAGA